MTSKLSLCIKELQQLYAEEDNNLDGAPNAKKMKYNGGGVRLIGYSKDAYYFVEIAGPQDETMWLEIGGGIEIQDPQFVDIGGVKIILAKIAQVELWLDTIESEPVGNILSLKDFPVDEEPAAENRKAVNEPRMTVAEVLKTESRYHYKVLLVRIIHVSEIQMKKDMPCKTITVADKTGQVRFSFWNNEAHRAFTEGTYLLLRHSFTKLGRDGIQYLYADKASMEEIAVTDIAAEDEIDMQNAANPARRSEKMKLIKVVPRESTVFPACPKKDCRFKKINLSGECTNAACDIKVKFTEALQGAKMKLIGKNTTSGEQIEGVVFRRSLEKMKLQLPDKFDASFTVAKLAALVIGLDRNEEYGFWEKDGIINIE